MRKKGSVVFIIAIAVILAVTLIVQGQKEKRQTAYMTELKEEAKPYENELTEIRMELQNMKAKINEKPETSVITIGFVPTSGDDISKIKDLFDSYTYTPLIILDCSLEQETLMDIIAGASENGYEMIPSGMTFDDQVLENAVQIQTFLPEYGYEGAPSFFIRKVHDSEENRKMLEDKGYHSFVRYSDALKSGITDSGSSYITYGFVRGQSAISGTFSQIIAAASYTVIAIDFSDIENRLISLRDVAELLQTADEKTTSGEVQYVNMGELFQMVADDSDRADRLSEEYEQYEIKQQKRIEELEEKINEIYSHWDQY